MTRFFVFLCCCTGCVGLLSLPVPPENPPWEDPPVVEERVRVFGYQRKEFGDGWAPAGECTTREAMLSELPGAELRSCALVAGAGTDPYTGKGITWQDSLDIDHVVPLSAAWDMGAFAWPEGRRVEFANDPLNLVVTSAEENRAKSDGLPSEWLPSEPRRRCWYVRRLAAVVTKYGLALTREDVRVMRRACLVREWAGR